MEQGFNAAGLLVSDQEKMLNIKPGGPCTCGSTNWGIPQPLQKATYFCKGPHLMHKASWHCQDCQTAKAPSAADLQAARVWPGSASEHQADTFIDEEVLDEWDRLKSSLPGSSLQGFLNTKQRQSFTYGGQEGLAEIQQQMFQTVFNEYKHRQYDVSTHVQGILHFVCPSCWKHLHSAHTDGNVKLNNFDRNREPFRQTYHHDLMMSDEEMKAIQEGLDSVLGTTAQDNDMCRGIWKAAGDKKKSSANKYYTGRSMSVCRHIMVLPDAHGRAHAWHCQVLYGAGYREGVALGSGEFAELFFAYMSRLALTTRQMSPAGSTDAISEAACHWNARKVATQAPELLTRYRKATNLLAEAEKTADDECRKLLQLPYRDSRARLLDLLTKLQTLARAAASGNQAVDKKRLEYFQVSQRLLDANLLQDFASSGPPGAAACIGVRRLLAAVDGDLDAAAETARQLLVEREKLQIRQNQLRMELFTHVDDALLSTEQLLQKTLPEVADMWLGRLRDELEALVAIKARHEERSKHRAETAKERTAYHKKLRADVKQVDTLVKRHNQLAPFGSQQPPLMISTQEILEAKFGWAGTIAVQGTPSADSCSRCGNTVGTSTDWSTNSNCTSVRGPCAFTPKASAGLH
ncbi:hypothetical protein WJX73_002534 [Symbiochloris irregularis]|uniref:CxC3 like cysteine cluster domain-containing protein n=1 Tax=Symbiochloris irregularis TaxID=706552 RepID=A0AAW1NPB3_9CHLO